MKITLLMALTVDGKIAKDSNQLIDWTESADKKLFIDITKEAGCMVMGSKTFDTIGKALPNRKNIVLTRNKSRKSDAPNLVFTDMEPEALLASLKSEGFDKVILVGGAIVNSIFASKNLIDEVAVTISPKIFGSGLSLFSGEHDLDLELKEVVRLGHNSVFLRYAVLK